MTTARELTRAAKEQELTPAELERVEAAQQRARELRRQADDIEREAGVKSTMTKVAEAFGELFEEGQTKLAWQGFEIGRQCRRTVKWQEAYTDELGAAAADRLREQAEPSYSYSVRSLE